MHQVVEMVLIMCGQIHHPVVGYRQLLTGLKISNLTFQQ